MRPLLPIAALIAGAALLLAPAALAQSSSTDTAVGGSTAYTGAPNGSATGGTGGTAAVGGNSASTLGLGGTSTLNGQTSSALGVGGSAASASGTTAARAKVNPNLNGQAKATARDGGTFAKSQTHTKVTGDDVASRTKTMSHVPGQKPVKSTTVTGR
ncbi:MAG TPA: hypothetical protein VL460_00045 [Caulobacteraceae bacterium]|jgi:hypothetical protein|nr:hypothetical protein [Caulobacteraceae bacterium]